MAKRCTIILVAGTALSTGLSHAWDVSSRKQLVFHDDSIAIM